MMNDEKAALRVDQRFFLLLPPMVGGFFFTVFLCFFLLGSPVRSEIISFLHAERGMQSQESAMQSRKEDGKSRKSDAKNDWTGNVRIGIDGFGSLFCRDSGRSGTNGKFQRGCAHVIRERLGY